MSKKGSKGKKKEQERGFELVRLVFSWSIKDVINKDLFKDKVKQIPESFSSSAEYLNSFMDPLIEEIRADFCSSLECVYQSPVCEISHLAKMKSKVPQELFYQVSTKRKTHSMQHCNEPYGLKSGDIILLTNSRLRKVEDLNTYGESFLMAYVVRQGNGYGKYNILLSKNIEGQLNSKGLFATYMMNLTTNLRIWWALKTDPQSSNLSLIQRVLHYDSFELNDCSKCLLSENMNLSNVMSSFNLDESQRNAILSSISMKSCTENDSKVKLIWGPPGTGKTKTVASLLFALLKLKCRTLTCAPTNIAVVQVAKRLMSLVLESQTHRLGDIVLLGNEQRMKIDSDGDLANIFLNSRVEVLHKSISNWKPNLESMMSLLRYPEKLYSEYKKMNAESSGLGESSESRSIKEEDDIKKEFREKGKLEVQSENPSSAHLEEDGSIKSEVQLLSFEEFVEKSLFSLAEKLKFCANNFYTQLPTSCIPSAVEKDLIGLINCLRKLECVGKNPGYYDEIVKSKIELLSVCKSLYDQFPGPKFRGTEWDMCLSNACLIFCTAISSIKVRGNVEMVIIDEAAQLKECESVIPFSIRGLRSAVLIGDDRQLPAMVQSKVSENAYFGRSLFQRLTGQGKKKHMLSIQYRMHPSISLFPNKEFYESRILDASHVKGTSYQRNFLEGEMFGSYSFIDVERGIESFTEGHSPRNVEEAAVIDHIIAKLFEGYCTTNQKVSVGVISPYKGQVGLIQEKIGKKYANLKDFTVSVRSVDGFQGGEEDVIIISTVRCNRHGAVGFLSSHQRTNVALTRARYCLWIVGNGDTLSRSGSVWKEIVIDAQKRGCFYNADDAIGLNGKQQSAFKFDFMDSLKLGSARWKVLFTDAFKTSFLGINEKKSQEQVQELLEKLAHGWRQSNINEMVPISPIYGMATELLKQYQVDENLYLIWTIDIQDEQSEYTQVIKVWDVLPPSEIPKLAEKFRIISGKYTVDFVNRCKYKSSEGNLVVPKSWPIQSAESADYLSDQLSAMNIRDYRNLSSCRII